MEYGFGVIAQALWLTQKMEGDADVLTAILEAKKIGDYDVPSPWRTARSRPAGASLKAIMAGDKKNNLGVVMSGKDKDKDKDNPGNNGSGGDNGNGNDNGSANHPNKDKDKDKGNNSNNGNNGNKDNNGKNKP